MKKTHAQTAAKVIGFSVVATIASVVLKSDGHPNTIATLSGIGIATATLIVSEQQRGVE